MIRYWKNYCEDDGSIHSIGNGEMLIYGLGPNIVNFFGPPYSSASFFTLNLFEEGIYRTESYRDPGTAIWNHDVFSDNVKIGTFVDYIFPDNNIFIRRFSISRSINFLLKGNGKVYDLENYFHKNSDSFLIRIPKGTRFFTEEVTNLEQNLIVTSKGNCSFAKTSEGSVIRLKAGSGELIFSSYKEYPDVVKNLSKYLHRDSSTYLNNVKTYWEEYSSRRKDFASFIPDTHPLKSELLEAIDSISVLNKCQQSSSGAFCAGHYYPMGYIRDQAGVLRCMLALGYHEEAKAVLSFWWHKFQVHGNLYNAEGMDNDSARLLFINDEVENPAYIIKSAFHYLDSTKDNEFVNEIIPMLKWALEIQLPHIAGDMLEFSCDETYIAGGTFPKNLMYHGSAEATLLFVDGGLRFLNYLRDRKLLNEKSIVEYENIVQKCKLSFKDNFYKNGVLFSNNPLREKLAGRPAFRHGFCDAHEILDKKLFLSWTEKNDQNYFICPDCLGRKMPDMIDCEKLYILNSVNLALKYHKTSVFTDDEIRKIISEGIQIFKKTNRVPSCLGSHRSLGYDYGLMLYNSVKLNLEIKEDVLTKTLSLIDPTGAWAEYYDNDKPFNCRARTWESSINIEAIVQYISALEIC